MDELKELLVRYLSRSLSSNLSIEISEIRTTRGNVGFYVTYNIFFHFSGDIIETVTIYISINYIMWYYKTKIYDKDSRIKKIQTIKFLDEITSI